MLQIATNDSNINSTKKEFIVSFTAIGIAFKAIASSKVLNILPIVGNKSLAGECCYPPPTPKQEKPIQQFENSIQIILVRIKCLYVTILIY